MSKSGNNTFSDEMRQARGEPSPVMQAMIEVGSVLDEQACQVIHRVSEISPEIAENVQKKALSTVVNTLTASHEAEAGEGEPIKLQQGKTAIVQQREHHADSAMSQALLVRRDYHDTFLHKQNADCAALDNDLYASFQRMQRALLEAQRHLAALDILSDLENNLFSERARKGGHAQVRPAAQKEQERLLDAVVKNMMYNIYHDGNYKKSASKKEVTDYLTAMIFWLNQQARFLKIETVDDLHSDIQTSLNKRKAPGEDSHFVKGSMRRPIQMHETLMRMQDKLMYEHGVLKGGQDVLVCLMKKRFVALPEEAREAIDSVPHFEDLQPYVDRLLDAQSWRDVLGKSDSWREK
ncbi:hypothetical protein QC823_15265 [Halomonas vilamensis]|uniref:Uncharacterized protein n=1 Tax=Vreelandella vilamensis TaxID=531309 RepID=A0ABU1H9J7_9GAMM|nr:hypothetical protein [Halomonas vilamensis]MDR5900327.1 hypothetical protein [Halomonas vilamensis]